MLARMIAAVPVQIAAARLIQVALIFALGIVIATPKVAQASDSIYSFLDVFWFWR